MVHSTFMIWCRSVAEGGEDCGEEGGADVEVGPGGVVAGGVDAVGEEDENKVAGGVDPHACACETEVSYGGGMCLGRGG